MDFVDSTIDVVILLFAGTACAVILAIVLTVCVKFIRSPTKDETVYKSDDEPPHYEGH